MNSFLIRRLGGQKPVSWQIKNAKGRTVSAENHISGKSVFQNEGEIKTYTDKQKPREFVTTKPSWKKC